jgi:hypothetical protein
MGSGQEWWVEKVVEGAIVGGGKEMQGSMRVSAHAPPSLAPNAPTAKPSVSPDLAKSPGQKVTPNQYEDKLNAGLRISEEDAGTRCVGEFAGNNVEIGILDAFQEFYDNASNGNKTRGSMRNAIGAYVSYIPRFSPPLEMQTWFCWGMEGSFFLTLA